jgi:WD40 repeat protein
MYLLRVCLAVMFIEVSVLATGVLAQATEDRLGDPLPEGAVQRLGTLRLRGGIGDLAYLPDGRAIIAYGSSVEIWDFKTGERLFRERVISGGIRSMDVRADGKAVLLADSSAHVHEWDVAKNEILHSFPTGQAVLLTARYSPDTTRVLTTGANPPTLKEFELATGKELVSMQGSKLYGFRQGIYDAEGKTAFVDGSYSGDNPILAHYDLATGEVLHEWHNNYYSHTRSLALSPDGERILIGSRTMAAEYKIDGYEQLKRYTGHQGAAVTAVAYCKDPNQLLTGSRDGSIRRWDREKPEVLLRWWPHAAHCTHICVSPDGSRVLSYGAGMVVESHISTGLPTIAWERHSQGVEAVAVMPDGRRAVSGSSDTTLRLWNIATGEELAVIEGATLGAYAVAVAPDGGKVAAGCKDGVVREFSLPDGKLLRELTGHLGYVHSAAYTPDGLQLITCAGDGRIRIWSADSDEPIHVMREHRGGVLSVAVSADGRRALSGGRDGTVRLWDLEAAQLLRTFSGHRGWVEAVSFGVEGGYAFSSGRDGRILKWNLESGEIEAEMVPGSWVRTLACAPDGKYIYAAGDDGLISCWDLISGTKVATRQGHEAAVEDLAFTPDGEYLISASRDSSLLVWTRPETLLPVYVNAAGQEVAQLHRQGRATCWTEAQEGSSPQLAVDGDSETYSATTSGAKWSRDLPKDLGMEWHAPVVVGAFEIDYFDAGYAPTDDGQQLQAWDGEDWYPIQAQVSKDESGANWVYTFTPVTTSRIRIFITKFSRGRTAVREMRIFPEPARLQKRPGM